MKRKGKLLFTSLLLFAFGIVQAQDFTLKGIVRGDGSPLPGVNIVVKGTYRGVVTDFNGSYEIKVQSSDTLQYTFLGFIPQEIAVDGQRTIDVILSSDLSDLDEVVAVGYGTLERKDLTGSQVSLKSKDINLLQAVSFEEALKGKASGVQITSTSGGPGEVARMQIRGITSVNAGNAPLYVIDGVEIDGDAQAVVTGISSVQSSPLAMIDPETIESIEILKDANSTAIYGSRGANGVVIIKTKQGTLNQKLTLDFNVSSGIQTISNQIDLLGPQDYIDYYNEVVPWNPGNFDEFLQKAFRDDTGRPIPLNAVDADGEPIIKIRDWRDEIFRTAFLNKYNLNIKSGSENTWFSGSASYTDQQGVVKNSDYKRIQLSAAIGANISPRLQVGINLNGGNAKKGGLISSPSNDANPAGQSTGVITNLTIAPPVIGRLDQSRLSSNNGSYELDETGFITATGNGRLTINPLTQVNETVSNSNELFGFVSAYLEYTFLEALKFKSSVSLSTYQNNGESYYPIGFGYGKSTNGRADLTSFNQKRLQINNTLTYDKEVDFHKFNFVIGSSVLDNEVKIQNTIATNFLSNSVNLDDLSAAKESDTDTNKLENGLLGFLGRFNYTYKGKYVINLTGRADKSSKFFPGATQWGFFPSAGITWNVSNENFLKNNKTLSNFRLKASAGQSGNDKIGVFLSQIAYGNQTFVANSGGQTVINAGAIREGEKVNGFALQRVSNPDLTWETTTQYDIGAEIGLFNNRINIGADVFQKDTDDLLLNKRIPSQAGFSFVLENAGEVRNRGLEFTFKSINIDKGDFSWKTNFNISFVKNEIINLGIDDSKFEVTAPVAAGLRNDFIIKEGESIGSMFGYISDGVYQYDDFVEFEGLSNAESEELYSNTTGSFTPKSGVVVYSDSGIRPGSQKVKDLNGDGVIDVLNDRTVIGNANPKHFGGLTNMFSYKSWNLSFLLTWKYGNDIYNKNVFRGTDGIQPINNSYGVLRDRWTPNNQDTQQYALRGRVLTSNVSDFIEDGSYLRLQNISLSYNLPQAVVYSLGLNQVEFYTAVDNLFVLTNYSGYDPEVSVGAGINAGLTPGIDFDAYPSARTFRFGVKASF